MIQCPCVVVVAHVGPKSSSHKPFDGPHPSQTYDKKIRQKDQSSGGEKSWRLLEGHDMAEDIARLTCWSHVEASAVQPRDSTAAQ